MRAIAIKQPTNDSTKQKKSGDKGRSRSVSPLSTGMPLLQRQCACGGGCPRCQDELGIQTKLKIGEPGDKYEQEADRIADQIMRMSAGVGEELDELEEETIQTKSLSNPLMTSPPDRAEFSGISSIVGDVLNSPGEPMNPRTRNFMESRFGQDFSQVRIHADDRAATSAQSIHAQAYTAGNNIVFNTGLYHPETDLGKHLLAHELAHVVQQSGNQPLAMIQRTNWGPLGGKCCHESPEGPEWALTGEGTWTRLTQGECTGSWTDCDGMTCGGGFYRVSNLQTGTCQTPREDDALFRPRRWTPNNPNLPSDAMSPSQRGSQEGDTPPDYVYDPS
ncbi:MAG: DUF4157 domain-containing protein [Microcoleus sp. SU_5_3]|nr:DUF4157 domain-containing protein [Microcoleus sp. SU_5_3]